MILVDANLLIYAADRLSPHHSAAARWWREALEGNEPVAIPTDVLLAFLRIASDSKIVREVIPPERLLAAVLDWLSRPHVEEARPGERHWEILGRLLSDSKVRGADVMDAHLAAIAIDRGATLCTSDRGFSRFPGLQWRNPLAA